MATCLKCMEEFEISPGIARGETNEVSCPHCQSQFKVNWTVELEYLPPKEEKAIPAKTEAIKILVAIEGEATQELMKETLNQAGYEVLLATTGKEALSILEKEHPTAAYLDVGLPQVLGFEICEIIKRSSLLKDIRVILVPSIFHKDKEGYKREPSSLYGADDYIARHQIQDSLILKLNNLLHPENSESPSMSPQETPDTAEELSESSPVMNFQETFDEPPPDMANGSPKLLEPAPVLETPGSSLSDEDLKQHEEAHRFARLIISDIALYNQQAIEEGIVNGNIDERLKDDMLEAEKLYEERVPSEIRKHSNYLQEELYDLIERKKKTMGIIENAGERKR